MSVNISYTHHDEIMTSHTSTNMCPLECTPLDESLSHPFFGPHCQSPLPLPGLCCPPRPPPRPPPLLPNAPGGGKKLNTVNINVNTNSMHYLVCYVIFVKTIF